MSEARMSLAELLRLADWGPRQLVTAINSRLSSQGRDRLRLDPTAGYAWVRRGFRPRPPIPDVAAAVLTERLGFTVTAAQLWPGREEAGGPRRSAADDLDGVTHIDDFVRELSQLSTTAATPQSPIADASGADLTAAVLDQLRGAVLVARNRAGHDYVLPEQVDLISSHVAALRRLDDRHGGGALSLRYVTAELRSVVDLVEYASYGPKVGKRLLTIVADLAQLLGWLHFDSSRYGAAERYLLLSVGSAGRSARPTAPPMPSACSVTSRRSPGTAHRRSGSPKQQRANAERAILFCAPGSWAGRPRLLRPTATLRGSAASRRKPPACCSAADRVTPRSFLYYLTPEQLAAETGQGLVVLAERTTVNRSRLLSEAIEALSGAVSVHGGAGPCRRWALLSTLGAAARHFPRPRLPSARRAGRGRDGDANGAGPAGAGAVAAWPELSAGAAACAGPPVAFLLVREFLDEFDEASSPV